MKDYVTATKLEGVVSRPHEKPDESPLVGGRRTELFSVNLDKPETMVGWISTAAVTKANIKYWAPIWVPIEEAP